MFASPSAKRIKRSDLDALHQSGTDEDEAALPSNPPGSGSVDGRTAAEMPPDYGFEYDFVTPTVLQEEQPAKEPDEIPSYEFRLFSTATKPKSEAVVDTVQSKGPQLITLTRSPSPSSALPGQEGRLLRPRPASHYFASSDSSTKTRYASSAISSAGIQSLFRTPWPGTALPWRTTRIPPSQLHKSLRRGLGSPPTDPLLSSSTTSPTNNPNPNPNRRPKPNKTRRLALRRRVAARMQHSSSHAAQPKAKPSKPIKKPNAKGELELDLPPEEREKRTARNREKKVKRRQRERERKAAAADDDAGTPATAVAAVAEEAKGDSA